MWAGPRLRKYKTATTNGITSATRKPPCLSLWAFIGLTIIQQTNRQYIEPHKSYCQDSYYQKLALKEGQRRILKKCLIIPCSPISFADLGLLPSPLVPLPCLVSNGNNERSRFQGNAGPNEI
jgi:hypothetical protein